MNFVAAGAASLVDLFAFGVEDFVAAPDIGHGDMFAIDGDGACRFSAPRVTTAAVPHRAFVAEIKRGAAGIGRFLVVLEMITATAEGDALRVFDAESPARCVEHMDAVVADFAVAPMPAPMPVVMDEVVDVRALVRRSLPE